MSDMDEMEETSAGRIGDAFCYLREQEPKLKTDYIEPIKYDPGLAPPEEIITKLREVHKAIEAEEFDDPCAICFSIVVGDDRYVCACRIRTIRPPGERSYQMLKAFIVTSTDLDRYKASALSIGPLKDWEELERLKQPIMPVEIRKPDVRVGSYRRLTEDYQKSLHRVTESTTFSWPDDIAYKYVIQNARLAFQSLPPGERYKRNVAIGLPPGVVLPISLDLCVEQKPVIKRRSLATETDRPSASQKSHPVENTELDRLGKLGQLQDSLFFLRSAIEVMPRREKPDPTGFWRLRHWNQAADMNYLLLALYKKPGKGGPGAIATRQALAHIRIILDQLVTECSHVGYSLDLKVPLNAVEAGLSRFDTSTTAEKSPPPFIEQFQEWRAGLNLRSTGAWLALVFLVATAGIKRISGNTLIPGLNGDEETRQPKQNSDAGTDNTNSNKNSIDGDPPKQNPVTALGAESSPPTNPLAASIEAYTPDAFDHLFPDGIHEQELNKIKEIYVTWIRLPEGENKNKQRAVAYSAIINTLAPDEKEQLRSIKPLLSRLKFTPTQWAKLGPSDRLTQDQWANIKRAAQTAISDDDFKQQVKESLTETQRQILGWTN